MSEKYTVTLEERDGELVLPIPDKIMEEMDLTTNDTLGFEAQDDGTVIITKQKLFLVTEEVTHHVTYAVYAADDAAARERVANIAPGDPELAQQCVSSSVIIVGKVTEDEVVARAQAECQSWDRDYILDVLTIDRGERILPKD